MISSIIVALLLLIVLSALNVQGYTWYEPDIGYAYVIEEGTRAYAEYLGDGQFKLKAVMSGTIEIPGIGIVTRRLVCFEDKGFCRYYMELKGSEKPCEWKYFSIETLEILESILPRHVNRHQVTRYARRHNLVLPKYLRKISWRLMVKSISREVARFIQSRFGELRISEARYEDLLSEADEQYPKYLNIARSYAWF